MAVAYPKTSSRDGDPISSGFAKYIEPSERFPWYAVQVRTKQEVGIANLLRSKGYAPFVPLYKCRRRWSDRIKTMDAALFPGYLFCRFNVELRLPILKTPGVLKIVGCGKQPLEVEHAEISAVQTMVGSDVSPMPWPFPQVGEQVHIEQGPLAGLQGTLVKTKGGGHRFVVSVSLLQRSVAVEIDPAFVRPAKSIPSPM
jgi:transcription antitermination factor NusG